MSRVCGVVLTATVLAAALAAGCKRDSSEPELLASARTHLASNDAKTAVIELKNLLQATPESAPARQAALQTDGT